MSVLQNIDLSQNDSMKLQGKIAKIISLINQISIQGGLNFFGIINILMVAVLSNIQSRINVKKIRATFNTRTSDCIKNKNSAENLLKIKHEIRIMRDVYIKLEEQLKRISILRFFLYKSVHKAMIEWDDLLEDIDIGTDPEIHTLIRGISRAV